MSLPTRVDQLQLRRALSTPQTPVAPHVGFDGTSWVASSPIALPDDNSTVEVQRTLVLQKVDDSVVYHTLQAIHRRPTMIRNSL